MCRYIGPFYGAFYKTTPKTNTANFKEGHFEKMLILGVILEDIRLVTFDVHVNTLIILYGVGDEISQFFCVTRSSIEDAI